MSIATMTNLEQPGYLAEPNNHDNMDRIPSREQSMELGALIEALSYVDHEEEQPTDNDDYDDDDDDDEGEVYEDHGTSKPTLIFMNLPRRSSMGSRRSSLDSSITGFSVDPDSVGYSYDDTFYEFSKCFDRKAEPWSKSNVEQPAAPRRPNRKASMDMNGGSFGCGIPLGVNVGKGKGVYDSSASPGLKKPSRKASVDLGYHQYPPPPSTAIGESSSMGIRKPSRKASMEMGMQSPMAIRMQSPMNTALQSGAGREMGSAAMGIRKPNRRGSIEMGMAFPRPRRVGSVELSNISEMGEFDTYDTLGTTNTSIGTYTENASIGGEEETTEQTYESLPEACKRDSFLSNRTPKMLQLEEMRQFLKAASGLPPTPMRYATLDRSFSNEAPF